MSRLSIRQLSPAAFAARLGERAGLCMAMGPFIVRVRSRLAVLAPPLYALYGDFPVVETDPLADFQVALERPRTPRGWIAPQVLFRLDGGSLFEPFLQANAFPLFEWGLNWCVAQRSHQYLLLHAAAVERDGRALLLPATPGSGKSTLCAALIQRGWRLLSDEFGLFDFEKRSLLPLPRPVALKNESIEALRRFAPDAVLGPLFPKTRKGTVAHLRPPTAAVRRMDEPARPAWVLFPRFTAGARLTLRPVPKAQAFPRLAYNAFNYDITGADGFGAVAEMIRACDCCELRYGDLDAAVAGVDRLAS